MENDDETEVKINIEIDLYDVRDALSGHLFSNMDNQLWDLPGYCGEIIDYTLDAPYLSEGKLCYPASIVYLKED